MRCLLASVLFLCCVPAIAGVFELVGFNKARCEIFVIRHTGAMSPESYAERYSQWKHQHGDRWASISVEIFGSQPNSEDSPGFGGCIFDKVSHEPGNQFYCVGKEGFLLNGTAYRISEVTDSIMTDEGGIMRLRSWSCIKGCGGRVPIRLHEHYWASKAKMQDGKEFRSSCPSFKKPQLFFNE